MSDNLRRLRLPTRGPTKGPGLDASGAPKQVRALPRTLIVPLDEDGNEIPSVTNGPQKPPTVYDNDDEVPIMSTNASLPRTQPHEEILTRALQNDTYAILKGSFASVCDICSRKAPKYTCPRCSLSYCSLECYKDKQHGEDCTEAFYRQQVLDTLEASRLERGDANQRRVLAALHKVYTQSGGDGVDAGTRLGSDFLSSRNSASMGGSMDSAGGSVVQESNRHQVKVTHDASMGVGMTVRQEAAAASADSGEGSGVDGEESEGWGNDGDDNETSDGDGCGEEEEEGLIHSLSRRGVRDGVHDGVRGATGLLGRVDRRVGQRVGWEEEDEDEEVEAEADEGEKNVQGRKDKVNTYTTTTATMNNAAKSSITDTATNNATFATSARTPTPSTSSASFSDTQTHVQTGLNLNLSHMSTSLHTHMKSGQGAGEPSASSSYAAIEDEYVPPFALGKGGYGGMPHASNANMNVTATTTVKAHTAASAALDAGAETGEPETAEPDAVTKQMVLQALLLRMERGDIVSPQDVPVWVQRALHSDLLLHGDPALHKAASDVSPDMGTGSDAGFLTGMGSSRDREDTWVPWWLAAVFHAEEEEEEVAEGMQEGPAGEASRTDTNRTHDSSMTSTSTSSCTSTSPTTSTSTSTSTASTPLRTLRSRCAWSRTLTQAQPPRTLLLPAPPARLWRPEGAQKQPESGILGKNDNSLLNSRPHSLSSSGLWDPLPADAATDYLTTRSRRLAREHSVKLALAAESERGTVSVSTTSTAAPVGIAPPAASIGAVDKSVSTSADAANGTAKTGTTAMRASPLLPLHLAELLFHYTASLATHDGDADLLSSDLAVHCATLRSAWDPEFDISLKIPDTATSLCEGLVSTLSQRLIRENSHVLATTTAAARGTPTCDDLLSKLMDVRASGHGDLGDGAPDGESTAGSSGLAARVFAARQFAVERLRDVTTLLLHVPLAANAVAQCENACVARAVEIAWSCDEIRVKAQSMVKKWRETQECQHETTRTSTTASSETVKPGNMVLCGFSDTEFAFSRSLAVELLLRQGESLARRILTARRSHTHQPPHPQRVPHCIGVTGVGNSNCGPNGADISASGVGAATTETTVVSADPNSPSIDANKPSVEAVARRARWARVHAAKQRPGTQPHASAAAPYTAATVTANASRRECTDMSAGTGVSTSASTSTDPRASAMAACRSSLRARDPLLSLANDPVAAAALPTLTTDELHLWHCWCTVTRCDRMARKLAFCLKYLSNLAEDPTAGCPLPWSAFRPFDEVCASGDMATAEEMTLTQRLWWVAEERQRQCGVAAPAPVSRDEVKEEVGVDKNTIGEAVKRETAGTKTLLEATAVVDPSVAKEDVARLPVMLKAVDEADVEETLTRLRALELQGVEFTREDVVETRKTTIAESGTPEKIDPELRNIPPGFRWTLPVLPLSPKASPVYKQDPSLLPVLVGTKAVVSATTVGCPILLNTSTAAATHSLGQPEAVATEAAMGMWRRGAAYVRAVMEEPMIGAAEAMLREWLARAEALYIQ